MRYATAALFFVLSACGGNDGAAEGGILSSISPFSSGHSCSKPVLSGSAEQKACFAEAERKCPPGSSPSRIEFEQATSGPFAGQFLIKSYSCA